MLMLMPMLMLGVEILAGEKSGDADGDGYEWRLVVVVLLGWLVGRMADLQGLGGEER